MMARGLFVLPLLALATGAGMAQTVTASLRVIDDSALELRYDVPPSCSALAFLNEGIAPAQAADIRAEWQPLDACATADARQVQRRSGASCTTFRFRVPAATRDLDRIYPWAYPIGGGFFAHTSAYAVAPSCGAVAWQFSAAGGMVVLNGVPSGDHASAPPGQRRIDAAPVVLLTKAPDAASSVHLGPGLTVSDQRFLTSALGDSTAYLRRALPGLEVPTPYIVATLSPDAGNWRGDVANRTTMRLSLPSAPTAGMRSDIRDLIAHEAGHLPQPQQWRDAWGDDSNLFKEGGAEFLRWSVAASLGWKDHAVLAAELENAVNNCIIAAAGNSWQHVARRQWGRTPYDCGLAFHAIGLASRAGTQPAAIALRDYYRDAQERGSADFAQALECGRQADCQPRWLSRLAGEEPVATVLAAYARTPGALIRPVGAWSPALAAAVANFSMQQLMRADCNGGVSFYTEAQGYRVAAGPACATLRPDMVVTGAENRPFSDGRRTVQAIMEGCRDRRQVRLVLQDGGKVDVACQDISMPAEFYQADIDTALRRLTAAPPAPRLP